MKLQIIQNVVVLLIAVMMLSGCSEQQSPITHQYVNNGESTTSQPEVSEEIDAPILIDTEDYLNTLSDQEKCWMDITPVQYLEDFDFLYQEMKSNYPYFGVALRKKGVDIDEQYKLYRNKMEMCRNDNNYWEITRDFIMEIGYTGHIRAWGSRYMSEIDTIQSLMEFPEYADQLSPYLEKLENPLSLKNYQAMQRFYENVDKEIEAINARNNSVEANPPIYIEDTNDDYSNVSVEILSEDTIAYVKIGMFDMNEFHTDKEILYAFYGDVKEYDHLIIDITENPGGGMDYFNELVVAPLANKSYSVPIYQLVKDGDLNRHYLRMEQGIANEKWKPVSELPFLSEMNQADLNELDYFEEEIYTVKPITDKGFQGCIWLLVSENNYSSSEYAAMFSKHSGFATLVGNQTGGDGIGVDPTYIILPNSGLVIQYSPVYGVTSDGRNSEEFGTMPDILSSDGETALETCLRFIDDM